MGEAHLKLTVDGYGERKLIARVDSVRVAVSGQQFCYFLLYCRILKVQATFTFLERTRSNKSNTKLNFEQSKGI